MSVTHAAGFDRILLPLDGSPAAEAIIPQLRRILKRQDAEVFLLRAVLPLTPQSYEFGVPIADALPDATAYIRALETRLRDAGVRARGFVQQGFPAETILEAAREFGVTHIAMSTHGYTGISRWVFGSVTEKVLRASRFPLLVVRSFAAPSAAAPAAPPPAEELPVRRILAPIAPGAASLEVLTHAAGLARLFGAELRLLAVAEGPGGDPHSPACIADHLRVAATRPELAGLAVETVLRVGDPAEQILEACRELAVDLIAMTTHGRTGLSRWVFGSVTEKVLRAATVPLLVVRMPEAPAFG
ncbi:MAG: universal stress protein [Planctomycetes bacterium]|nr:universal stress protein [Planctomycetota bacterium]